MALITTYTHDPVLCWQHLEQTWARAKGPLPSALLSRAILPRHVAEAMTAACGQFGTNEG